MHDWLGWRPSHNTALGMRQNKAQKLAAEAPACCPLRQCGKCQKLMGIWVYSWGYTPTISNLGLSENTPSTLVLLIVYHHFLNTKLAIWMGPYSMFRLQLVITPSRCFLLNCQIPIKIRKQMESPQISPRKPSITRHNISVAPTIWALVGGVDPAHKIVCKVSYKNIECVY